MNLNNRLVFALSLHLSHFLAPGFAIIVAGLAFIVDFSQEVLVVCELFFVHTTHLALAGLLIHLTTQEILVVTVYAGNLVSEALLLELVVVLVGLPDHSLLVVKRLLKVLASLLLLHLAGEKLAHLFLLLANALSTTLVLKASAHFFLVFVALKAFLFSPNTSLLLRDNITSEHVHEVLGASLTRFEFSETIVLLLVKHVTVLHLSFDISHDLVGALLIG